jgi:glycosyltransferase involved in cell wall biosynthesis
VEIIDPIPSRPVVRPRVSVVVPAYNYGRFLTDCVESVLAQDGVDVDVLILDDASSDDTAAIAARLAVRDARVRVILHQRNQGHIATFNEGLFAVDGEYVVLLDADDMLPPGSLARATAFLEAHPEVGLVYGHPKKFTTHPPRPSNTRVRSWTLWSGEEWIRGRCRLPANVIATPEVVMRTAVMRDTGGLKASLPHTGDFELWMQMAARADVGRVNGPPQAYYRQHAASMRHTLYSSVVVDLRARHDAFECLFQGPASRLADADELLDAVRRRFASEALDRACRAYDRGRDDDPSVDEFVELAFEIWPNATSLPRWRAYERRRAVGHTARVVPPFVAGALVRRASEEFKRKRWERTGVL